MEAPVLLLIGAAGFGAVIGWYVYFVNRYRVGEVGLGDLASLIGIIGGGTILALFPAGTVLFGAYGIGLGLGFFGYFVVLLIMVSRTNKFGVEWFLDGRRVRPRENEIIPQGTATTIRPMGDRSNVGNGDAGNGVTT
jgi:hypothetical protein